MTHVKALFIPAATLLWSFATCACSSAEPATTQGNKETGKTPKEEPASTLAAPLSVTVTIPSVAPGDEGTKCLKLRLNNADAIKIGKVHNTLSPASHHLVVSAVTDPNETESDLFDCSPFRAVLIGAPLTVTQKHDDTVIMPDGVAFPLEADQLMHLETHYINTGSAPADVVATSELFPLKAPGDVQEASFLIIGTLDIQIPAMSEHENPWTFVTLPDAFADVNIYGATGHTHRFGTAARLALAGPDGDSPTTIYNPEPYTWTEAQLDFFEKPVHVPSGGGFSFQCAWNNPTAAPLTYGESALQEMCFFWTYYYPRKEGNRVLLAGLDKSPYRKKPADAGAP